MAESIHVIHPSKLQPHPRNTEFFDDIDGKKWEDFLESVKVSGIYEPVTVTRDHIIISGHQRVRACLELGMNEIKYRFVEFEPAEKLSIEDRILRQLIETNLQQRGNGNLNPVKIGLCWKELKKLNGIREGKANPKGVNQYTQNGEPQNAVDQNKREDVAEIFNKSVDTLDRYQALTDKLIPKFQEFLKNKVINATIGTELTKLSFEEQQEILRDYADNYWEMKFKEYWKSRKMPQTTKMPLDATISVPAKAIIHVTDKQTEAKSILVIPELETADEERQRVDEDVAISQAEDVGTLIEAVAENISRVKSADTREALCKMLFSHIGRLNELISILNHEPALGIPPAVEPTTQELQPEPVTESENNGLRLVDEIPHMGEIKSLPIKTKKESSNVADLKKRLGNIDLQNSRQRGLCWKPLQRGKLINSIIERYPVPPLYLVKSEDEGTFAIDGKQRIDAISNYIRGEYALDKNTPSVELKNGNTYELSNKKFEELPDEIKDAIKEYEIKIISIENATDDDLDTIFSRFNGGSAMDELIKTLNSAKSKEQINLAADHELYSKVNKLNFEKYDHKNLTVKSYLMLNDPNAAFAWAYVKKFMESTDISDDSIEELWVCFNRMLDIHVWIDEKIDNPKVKKNILDNLGKPTHFSSLIPIIKRSIEENIDISLFSEWVTKFYPGTKAASIDEDYNTAARSNRRENIRQRKEILTAHYNNHFAQPTVSTAA